MPHETDDGTSEADDAESLLAAGERLQRSGAWRWRIASDRLHCTAGWLQIHGCSTAPASLAGLEATIAPPDLPAFRSLLHNAIAGGGGSLVHRIVRRADGAERCLLTRLQVLRAAGDLQPQVIASVRDVTDEEHREAEPQDAGARLAAMVQERTRQLAAARDEAEAASSAKSAFLANMSHEIRTHLTTIVGLAELMRREQLPMKQLDRLEKMNEAARHLLSLIDGVLDLAKIEAGRPILNETTVDLARLLASVAEMVGEQAREKGLRLLTEMPPLPGPLIGDPTRIRQAMLNYASNAIKFTERGSVTLRLQVLQEEGGSVLLRFEARDTGIGVPAAARERIFRQFEQAANSLPRADGGTGLGLAIVSQIAARMGGEVGVEAAAGGGSTFWFTLRLQKVTRKRSGQLPAEMPAAAAATAERRRSDSRLLIVDDERNNRELILAMLETVDLRADCARSGEEAVAQATKKRYALILMDLQLPQIDGIEATRRIRRLPAYESVPIIGLSGNVLANVVDECQRAGMNDFVGKPFSMDALLEAVTRCLRSSSAA
ncbi:MAG: Sensory/regulatory protein RpfC [Accumulibacter sp.]|uniref:ATP-binding response regulator n=1 Tax=Accumulibacter sp. TaxID=2053492 RepID=UPI00120361C2|nr:response regulator [Accumulibacter sp.]TLD45538.1 MAG: Sensory/regulatory protein RpfC [Accumulibacter sp.]